VKTDELADRRTLCSVALQKRPSKPTPSTEDARDPGVEIGCGFLDAYAQFEGEAFVGFRLAVRGK